MSALCLICGRPPRKNSIMSKSSSHKQIVRNKPTSSSSSSSDDEEEESLLLYIEYSDNNDDNLSSEYHYYIAGQSDFAGFKPLRRRNANEMQDYITERRLTVTRCSVNICSKSLWTTISQDVADATNVLHTIAPDLSELVFTCTTNSKVQKKAWTRLTKIKFPKMSRCLLNFSSYPFMKTIPEDMFPNSMKPDINTQSSETQRTSATYHLDNVRTRISNLFPGAA
jgi:hypothetical protein